MNIVDDNNGQHLRITLKKKCKGQLWCVISKENVAEMYIDIIKIIYKNGRHDNKVQET